MSNYSTRYQHCPDGGRVDGGWRNLGENRASKDKQTNKRQVVVANIRPRSQSIMYFKQASSNVGQNCRLSWWSPLTAAQSKATEIKEHQRSQRTDICQLPRPNTLESLETNWSH